MCLYGVSVMYFVVDGMLVGFLVVFDLVKVMIVEVFKDFKEKGICVVMVIGDGVIIVKVVVEKFGIVEFYGEVKFVDKLVLVSKF